MTSEAGSEPAEPAETEDSEAPQKPEEPETDPGFEYPDDWSREPLRFAVENGILKGDNHRNLNPGSNITRAEMAAILVRLLGATEKVSLKAYRDVDPSAWYFEELSAAVAAGLFNGMSPTAMAPNSPITREQALVVLSRAFGVITEQHTLWKDFTDGQKISPYAREAVSAMFAAGASRGYEDNTMRPQNYITRAEVASLLYHLLSVIADTPAEIPAEGWVLYRGEEPLPQQLTLNGSLVLGQKTPAKLSPESWSVNHLVLHTGSDTEANLTGVQTGTLFFAPVSGSAKSSIQKVWLAGDSNYEGQTELLTVTGGTHTVSGGCEDLSMEAGSLTLTGDVDSSDLAPRTELKLNGSSDHVRTGDHVKFTMTGDARDLTAGEHSLVQVNGSVPTVVLKDCASMVLSGDARNVTMGYYGAISLGGSVSRLTAGDKSLITVAADADYVEAGQFCTVTLNGDAKEVSVKANTDLVLNGNAGKVLIEGPGITISGTGHIGTLAYNRKQYTCSVPCDNLDDSAYLPYYKDYEESLRTVQTQRIPCTADKDTKLFTEQWAANSYATSAATFPEEWNYTCIGDLPKGATVYNEYHPAGNVFYVSFVDEAGKTVYGWAPRFHFHIPDGEVVTWDGELDYSQATKEGFVDLHGYSSKTDRLIWVNRYTQRVMIYHGQKGAWKLDKTFQCSSGSNNSPTRAGTYELESHMYSWYFDNYYVDHVTGFWGDHAFHTVLKNYGGGYADGRVGIPLSHGCIRMTEEGASYIEKMPMGTAVIVW